MDAYDAHSDLLRVAKEAGLDLNRTKVTKLLYLADLRAVRHGQEPSGLPWVWHKYGPWSNNLYTLASRLQQAGELVVESVPFLGDRYRLLRLRRASGSPYVLHLRAVVGEYGHLSAGVLRDFTYQTAPMLRAQDAVRGVPLDLRAEHEADVFQGETPDDLEASAMWLARAAAPRGADRSLDEEEPLLARLGW